MKSWGLQSWGSRGLRRGPKVRESRVCGPPSHPVPAWLHVAASSSLGAHSVLSATPSSGCGLAFPGCPRPVPPGFLPAHLQLPVSGRAGFLCPPGFGLALPRCFLFFLLQPLRPFLSVSLPWSLCSLLPTPFQARAPRSITFPQSQQLCILLAYPAVLALDHRGHVICYNK